VSVARREAVRRLALGGLGAAALPAWAEALVGLAETQSASTPAADWSPRFLDARQLQTVGVLAERIIPATDTPGALAAGVDRFIDGVLAAAGESQRREFLRGLGFTDDRSRQLFGADFAQATPDQQNALLTTLSSEQSDFFRVIKALTVSGYYGSQVGLQQELGDDGHMVFGEFPGCRHPQHLS
jgi:hypothetical protein